MYEHYFRLRGKPFSLTPDTRFFFGSPAHNRVLAFLRYGIFQSEGFIVVTGSAGTGKTMLVHTLLKEIVTRKDIVAAHVAMTQWGADDLLPMVAAAFSISDQGLSNAGLLQRLRQFLENQLRNGRRAILIVDEVQNLSRQSLETLRLLINFQVEHRALLQGFLIGQPGFGRKLVESGSLEALRQRVIASCHLEPLTAEETRRYIEHRLAVVEWRSDPSFLPNAYEAIYRYTKGIPRRINTFCDRVLLVAGLEEAHEISDVLVRKVFEELRGEISWSRLGLPDELGPEELDVFGEGEAAEEVLSTADSLGSKRLLRIEERLSAIEHRLATVGTVENRTAVSIIAQGEDLRAQLEQALLDKRQVEEEFAAHRVQAVQEQMALEQQIEELLSRLLPECKQEIDR